MKTSVRFIVVRSSFDESTFAIVTADVQSNDLTNEKQFLRALIRTITNWMIDSSEGRDAWSNSSEDFNIGDLSIALGGNDQGTDDLKVCLEQNGITNLVVETISETDICQDWVYDTILADSGRIQDDDDNRRAFFGA